ncbi:aminotransferase class IV [Salipiger sp. PrR002]|uniref:aminotransferase class IV n=1 Tax=Salipiger sp. PrR002 TaxID=2706489 RepID=UPI0013BDB9DA|nr:aminotransferase class IV [Salipiger sp. PrR002]NDW02660.1 branched-chain amino acid--2-keto-4-methylthiobutyrate aminotransferase [Salipiger sp. PrR002]NDW59922.1 branched-chain amino acid--2-keto-4-methylthiobutyrate aminotransferase [Salipiger sp. PrR004]
MDTHLDLQPAPPREDAQWPQGAAYLDGTFMPAAEARIPAGDWGYRRSDVTYDVVGVWDGCFFRLDDHIARFRASMTRLRMQPRESDAEVREVLIETVRRSGLRSAYVSMDCLRGSPAPGAPRIPSSARPWLLCQALPWVWVASLEQQRKGVSLMIPEVRRIPAESFDPRVKNFHWGDLTDGLFEAEAAGADFPILLDGAGHVTEGPGFNVFCVVQGKVLSPRSGALEGITRRSVLELCEDLGLPSEVRDIPAEEFRAADEIFCATTAGGVWGAGRIDGRALGNDAPGEITERLRTRFWRKRAEGWHATPVTA